MSALLTRRLPWRGVETGLGALLVVLTLFISVNTLKRLGPFAGGPTTTKLGRHPIGSAHQHIPGQPQLLEVLFVSQADKAILHPMPEGAGENPHEITGLSMTEIQALLNKSSQDALFRYPLKCPIDQDHIIDIAHMKRHIADCRRVPPLCLDSYDAINTL